MTSVPSGKTLLQSHHPLFLCRVELSVLKVAVQKQSAMHNAVAMIYAEGQGRSLSGLPEIDTLMNSEHLDEVRRSCLPLRARPGRSRKTPKRFKRY